MRFGVAITGGVGCRGIKQQYTLYCYRYNVIMDSPVASLGMIFFVRSD